jgi:DNA (cytosine-5)-methyltransferase 1
MKFVSLFSGIGGFDLGFERSGMECVLQVEQDDFALQVLEKHWPNVLRMEDVHELNKTNAPAADLICGGFPCQDLSVAGRRAGLAGERSGLWWEFARIIGELRPRWVVIENVPGLLSSNKGKDMDVLCSSLAELGYWWAYRVLDSQYYGVAQRRRRVFIVANSTDPAGPAKVLFEPESGSGDTPPSREKGQGYSSDVAPSIAASGRGTSRTGESRGQDPVIADVVPPLTSIRGGGSNQWPAHNETANLVPDVAYATNSRNNRYDLESQTLVVGRESGQGYWMQDEVAGTLRSEGENRPSRPSNVIAFTAREDGRDATDDLSPTLRSITDQNGKHQAGAHGLAVAWHENQGGNLATGGETAKALKANASKSYQGVGVSRLTPTECERLQSFPDGHTAEGSQGEISDTQRYKMLGNAVTVNVIEWLGKRIAQIEKAPEGLT